MKILVTGGAGFIGSHIVDQLIEQDEEVIVIDNLSTGNQDQLHPKAKFYQAELTDADGLIEILSREKPEVVIHQAAQTRVQTSVDDPVFDADTNILGTIHLLEACHQTNVRKLVFASSAAVYGDPTYLPIDESHPIRPLSGYGIGKHTAEQYLHVYKNLYGLEYTILRYANVYGPRQDPRGEGGVISVFLNRLIQERELTIFGDGQQTRDYVFVEDIARANIAAITHGEGQVMNVGTGHSTSLNQLVELMAEITGKAVKKEYQPARSGDIKDSAFHYTKAKEMLVWEPKVALKEGLRRTYQYYFPSI